MDYLSKRHHNVFTFLIKVGVVRTSMDRSGFTPLPQWDSFQCYTTPAGRRIRFFTIYGELTDARRIGELLE